MTENKRSNIGVAVFIMHDEKLLLGKRKGSHGAGTWAPPGGHIEMFEDFEKACKKEIKEETNLDIELKDKKPFAVTNDLFKEINKHYITLHFRGICKNPDELKIMEPNKCEEWKWVEKENMPGPLFLCTQNLIKSGHNIFE